MAIGDLVTAPNMYELNGIVLGHGTDFIVTKVENLFGKSDVKTTDFDRQDAWGEFPGRNMYKGRIITLTVDILGLPDPNALNPIDTNYLNLMSALALPDLPGATPPSEFVFQKPWTSGAKRYCLVVPGKTGIISDSNWVTGHIQAAIQLKANDPRHYALTTVTDTLNLAQGAESINESCQNNGDTAGMPVVTIEFTLSNAQWTAMSSLTTTKASITNATDSNKAIIVPLSSVVGPSYPAGGTINFVVDFRQRTIMSNGVDVSGQMDPSTRFWKLQPGANTLNFDMGEAFPVPATIQIQHQDTWSG